MLKLFFLDKVDIYIYKYIFTLSGQKVIHKSRYFSQKETEKFMVTYKHIEVIDFI